MSTLCRGVILALASLGTSGCTLCKPVVGAFTGPIVLLSAGGGDFSGCGAHGNGEGVVYLFAALSAVGVVGGFVTGVISDVQVMTGRAHDPCRNWADPFRTNTSR